jgi:hypothetical protein
MSKWSEPDEKLFLLERVVSRMRTAANERPGRAEHDQGHVDQCVPEPRSVQIPRSHWRSLRPTIASLARHGDVEVTVQRRYYTGVDPVLSFKRADNGN